MVEDLPELSEAKSLLVDHACVSTLEVVAPAPHNGDPVVILNRRHIQFPSSEVSRPTFSEEKFYNFVLRRISKTRYFVWLGGAVVRALDLRLEVAGSIPAAALSSATLDNFFAHTVQRLWCYNLMALYKSV